MGFVFKSDAALVKNGLMGEGQKKIFCRFVLRGGSAVGGKSWSVSSWEMVSNRVFPVGNNLQYASF